MATTKNTFSLFDTVVISLACIIGAGIFIVSGVAINRTNTSIFASILIAAFLATLSGVCFVELTRFIDKEGGVYEYTREGFSQNVGFSGSWVFAFALLSIATAAGVNIANYINAVFGASYQPAIIAVIPIGIATLALLLNIRLSSKLALAFVAINLVAVAIFLFFGARFVTQANLFSRTVPFNLGDVLFGAAVTFMAFCGFVRVAIVKREIVNPIQTLTRTFVVSMVLLFLIYLAMTVATMGILGASKITSVSALLLEAYLVNNRILLPLFAVARLASLFGLILFSIYGASRIFFAMGRDNEIPGAFQTLNKNSAPTNSIIVCGLISVLLAFIASFPTIVDSASGGVLLSFMIVGVTAMNVNLKEKENKRAKDTLIAKRYFLIVAAVAVLGDGALLLSISKTALGITFGILLVGSIYYNYGKVLIMPKGSTTRNSPASSEIREFVK